MTDDIMYMLGEIKGIVTKIDGKLDKHVDDDADQHREQGIRLTSLETSRTVFQSERVTYAKMCTVAAAIVGPFIALYHFFVR